MSTRRSLGLTAATRLVVVGLSLTTVVIVSRLLSPEEIGIFSVSVALITIGHVFRDFGVGHFLLQTPEVTVQRKRAAFTVTLTFSWSIALLLWVASPFASEFYRDSRVGEVLIWLSVNFLILPFGSPLRTLLQRDLQFGKLALVNIANHVTQSAVTVGSAWAGASHLSMAYGSIAGNIANVLVLLALSPRGALDWPTHRGLREVLEFGSKSATANLAEAGGAAAPDLILGRTLGFSDVAYFSRAKGLIGLALDQLMYVVSTVYTPTFAKGVREGRDAAALYRETTALLLGITLPIMALLAVLSPSLIVVFFGANWERSGPLGSMFCMFAMCTAPFALAGSSLIASGHIGAYMRTRLLIEASRIGALLSSMAFELEVVVALLGIAYLVEAIQYARALQQRLGLKTADLARACGRSYALAALSGLAPAALVAYANSHGHWSELTVLVCCTATGLLGWLIGVVALKHPVRNELVRLRDLVLSKLSAPTSQP